ncbi:MAG: thioredoxin domain-containing protein [Acetobacteraceae bacterium]|nr:thioredoxin domain-containing protein [Acetobacteraceae bacterium]
MEAAANLLRHETSPYLLQHARNPVHWRPWGQAALAEAVAEDKPILLSVGYAACHWCHVMAHESFEDDETAALMNRLFVNIKVDREERPDIDHLYMSALNAMGEQGGWPLTMFLTPSGEPFWGGTYFPPEPRWGRPSFRQVLAGVAEAYRTGHHMVEQNSRALKEQLASLSAPQQGGPPSAAHLDAAATALLRLTDPHQGGLRGAPKFPNAPIFRFLWQNAHRTGRPEGCQALHLMLERMSQGGIYDHLGGGYARYATDAEWLVPHFEKMLYDNAQLLELLALAYADRPEPLYAARAAETVGWLERDMTAAETADGLAAFAASEDADSEGQEGRFYVWTEAEIDRLLGPDAAAFKSAYDVRPAGNWEGRTILRRLGDPATAEQEATLRRCRDILFRARLRRVRPGRDDKVLADWNGLAIAALARAALAFRHPDWLARAARAFDFIASRLAAPDGRIQHAWRLDRITAAGLLEDQASMARAALALYETTAVPHYLEQAIGLAEAAVAHFADAGGGFYQTAGDAADIPLARPLSAADQATPSGNGLIAEVFARLYHLTGEDLWRRHCETTVGAFTGLSDQLALMPTLLAASDLLEGAVSVVIAGDLSQPRARALADAALTAPDPRVVVLRAADTETLPAGHPAYAKTAPAHAAVAYVCHQGVCRPPVEAPEALRAQLAQRRSPDRFGG